MSQSVPASRRSIEDVLALAEARVGDGDGEGAIELLREAERLAVAAGDCKDRIVAMLGRADVELRLFGRFSLVWDLAREIGQLCQAIDWPAGESRALTCQAIAAARLGRHEAGVDAALLAARLSRPDDAATPSIETVLAHWALGITMFSGRCYAEAIDAWRQGIDFAHKCSPPADLFVLQADLAAGVAMLAFSERNQRGHIDGLDGLAAAVQSASDALEDPAEFASLGLASRSNTAVTHALSMTLLSIWRYELEAAPVHLNQFRLIVGRSPRPWLQAAIAWCESELALAQGDLVVAHRSAEQVVEVATAYQHAMLANIGLGLCAHIASRSGDYAAAFAALQQQSYREQAARADSLRGRVEDVQRQVDLRERTRQLEAAEARQAHFQALAMNDALTGLPNRRSFEAQMHALLGDGADPARNTCVVMIDVDRFKQINDGHSHAVGDAVLQAVAALLKQTVRAQDTPARLAGDEFVIILRETSVGAAQALCERLDAAVRRHTWADVAPGLQVSVSLGVAPVLPGDDLAAVLHRSDEGMYRHKRARQPAAAA